MMQDSASDDEFVEPRYGAEFQIDKLVEALLQGAECVLNENPCGRKFGVEVFLVL